MARVITHGTSSGDGASLSIGVLACLPSSNSGAVACTKSTVTANRMKTAQTVSDLISRAGARLSLERESRDLGFGSAGCGKQSPRQSQGACVTSS